MAGFAISGTLSWLRAADIRIPVFKYTGRIVLPDPGVKDVDAERLVEVEAVPEGRGQLFRLPERRWDRVGYSPCCRIRIASRSITSVSCRIYSRIRVSSSSL